MKDLELATVQPSAGTLAPTRCRSAVLKSTHPPRAVHLTLRWRDDVIAIRDVGREDIPLGAIAPLPISHTMLGFVLARVTAAGPCAYAAEGHVATVWRGEDHVELIEGPATIPLAAGDVAKIRVGEFELAASTSTPEVLPRGKRRAGALWSVALAAAAHAVVLGLAAHDARASMAEADDHQVDTMRKLLASAEHEARAGEVLPVEDAGGKGQGRKQNDRPGDGRAGGGERAPGAQGKAGDQTARPSSKGRYAVPSVNRHDESPMTTQTPVARDAADFGMIGLLAQGPKLPAASFGEERPHGADVVAAQGSLWDHAIGDAFGGEALGLRGIGEFGGGVGEGIGLGRIGTLGHTDGPPGTGLGGQGGPLFGRSGDWGDRGSMSMAGRHTGFVCHLPAGRTAVANRLPPEAIQRIVRENFGRFRACYEAGLTKNPALAGTVTTRFVIGHDGASSSATNGGSSLPDASVAACVTRAFDGLRFPAPPGGVVTVTYPIAFSPE